MKLTKKDGYDIYGAELSYAELLAFRDGCLKLGGPIADSSAKAINWYIDHELPGPGEDKEAKKGEAKGDDADEMLPDVPNGAADLDGPVSPAPASPDELPEEPAKVPSAGDNTSDTGTDEKDIDSILPSAE